MTIKTNPRRLLLTISTLVCCAIPMILQAASAEALPPWALDSAFANNRITSSSSASSASTSSGIASWYQNRQRNLSAQNSDLGSLQRMADAGDVEAQYKLGLVYQSGRGVERNLPLARQLFERATQSGSVYAQYALALLLREQGGQPSLQRSVQLQEKAALAGHPEAQYGLGMLYANGQYVPRDVYKARHWLQQAKLRGNEMAQLALQDLPAQGAAGPSVQSGQRYQAPARPIARQAIRPAKPVVTTRPVRPVKPANQPVVLAQPRPLSKPSIPVSAATNTVATNAGIAILPSENRSSGVQAAVEHNVSSVNLDGMSVTQIRSAARQGDKYAQLMLGALYEDGSDGVQQSYESALNWYLKSAHQGYPKAQHNLALLYEDGRGTRKSYKQAAIWYKKAAQAGFSEAQNNLAVLYILGKGVEENRDYAEQLLRQAIAAGNPDAKRNLGMLLNGGNYSAP